ncbi:MAG: hypothetical protein HY821_12135, partial [Acidobacteria bacterium]|nr:hypothetical protein [Acidobacteriota bacterium]
MGFQHLNSDSGPRPISTRPPAVVSTPSDWANQTLHFTPDPQQSEILDSPATRVLLCCTRQWGKSTVTAIRALHYALHHPNALILCVSPVKRQSALFLTKARHFLKILNIPSRTDPRDSLSLLLPNGSALIGLPAIEANTRGFSAVDFLILDEAARIPDSAYHAIRPFLATTNGLLWMLSTPHGESGFFYDEWHKHAEHWTRL